MGPDGGTHYNGARAHDYRPPMPPATRPLQYASRPPISAVLITQDAASHLPECLATVAFCDEILIVDSGSTDGTPELAERLGARVIRSHWRGFGPQKRFAVSQASNDWVLCVDADERVTPELRSAIELALDCPTAPAVAYRFARCNRFMGRYLRHGEGYPDWSLRFFDRRRAEWSEDEVHEKVVATGPVASLAGDLLHDSADSLETYLAKQNRYSSLAASEALAKGGRTTAFRLLVSPVLRFAKFFFLRAGLLDGVPGLIHILFGCGASFGKHAKMLESQKRKR